jgi:hypothetical protein
MKGPKKRGRHRHDGGADQRRIEARAGAASAIGGFGQDLRNPSEKRRRPTRAIDILVQNKF